MSTSFRRPALASFFYGFAAVCVLLSLAGAIFTASIARALFGPGASAGYGILLLTVWLIQCVFYVAIAYAIEKIAKIEWNTRPENQLAVTAPGKMPTWSANKQFYATHSGQTHGPLHADGLINLYRDGKLTKSSQILVEENGYRRLVTDWSEFGL